LNISDLSSFQNITEDVFSTAELFNISNYIGIDNILQQSNEVQDIFSIENRQFSSSLIDSFDLNVCIYTIKLT